MTVTVDISETTGWVQHPPVDDGDHRGSLRFLDVHRAWSPSRNQPLRPDSDDPRSLSSPHRISTERIVRNGDLCFIDIGAMWSGYFADIGRTTVVGTPTVLQRRIYSAAYEGLMAGIDQMRPSQAGCGNP